MTFNPGNNKKDIVIAVVYAILFLALGAYYNYMMPYNADPVATLDVRQLLLWIFCYVPLGLFTFVADWKIKDFGFSINLRVGLASVPVLLLCAPIAATFDISWHSALIEAFARTGEEVFFRGFLYLLLLKIFSKKARPAWWAIFISALIFALIHTQIFQAPAVSTSGTTSVGYRILEELSSVFLISVALALLRHWTQSILPGVLVHGIMKGGMLTLPFCFLIYAGIVLWAQKRGEDVFTATISKDVT